MNGDQVEADICIVCEGSYPYSTGGVAQWVHELITEHKDKTFHILTLVPPHPDLTLRYKLPENVVGNSRIIVQDLPEGEPDSKAPKDIWEVIAPAFKGLISSSEFDNFSPLLHFFRKHQKILGKRILCESMGSWNFCLDLYREMIPAGPFKAYFGTAYTLSRSLYSVILPELPRAKVFHAVCTGYAGFILHRAKIERGVPCILTEHGIYSNERRIEIAMADWIAEMGSLDLALEDRKRTLKDFWLNAFLSFAHACYSTSDEILSTFDGNQDSQIEGGADPKKVRTIVHGIKEDKRNFIKRDFGNHPPIVAFMGRIVPIKDVKTLIRACQIVVQRVPEVQFLFLGPTSEDPEYFVSCQKLVTALDLNNHIKFLGKVNLNDYFPKIDLLVLTSISEAQPLVILEAGATGIPCVATNVGACSQLIYGDKDELPYLGYGGIVTPLVNPEATASAIIRMLLDTEFRKSCSETISKRIETYYKYEQEFDEYRKLYDKYLRG